MIHELHQKFGSEDAWAEMAARAEPPTALRLDDNGSNSITRADATAKGQAALGDGQVGMILVAGGQGSRLGFDHPKGMFPIGPVSGRTLFQVHIDKLKALNEQYNQTISLFVMTSPATDQPTKAFLQENKYFGYPPEYISTFCQGTMPAVDCQSGKLLLADKGNLFLGPDGHGGMLAALDNSGSLQKIKDRGLKHIFYCQIDNPLCQICDAATIGYHIDAGSELTAQAAPKVDPLQKVGNIVAIDGKVCIIEYSDLPDEVAKKTTADGGLQLWAGNIAVHIFDVNFLDRMAEQASALPFHLAHKKVPFVDDQGNLVKPDEPNAIKFERFIFDLLPMAERSIVVEVDPPNAFSPVKNANTENNATPHTAQQAMIAQYRRALAAIDVTVADGVAVEIDPRLLNDPNKLRTAVGELQEITEPSYLK